MLSLAVAPVSVKVFWNQAAAPPTSDASVVRSYPHDERAFTQGLFFERGGTLIESTGIYGESSIRRVELESGRVLKRVALRDEWFGEGASTAAAFVQAAYEDVGVVLRQPSRPQRWARHPYRSATLQRIRLQKILHILLQIFQTTVWLQTVNLKKMFEQQILI